MPRYSCNRGWIDNAEPRCIAFGGLPVDDEIGRILAQLDALSLADDTLVVFTSDNGGERFSDSWPLVGGKMDLTEGGIRVPWIAHWPAGIAPGGVSAQHCLTMDWSATMLDLAGAVPDAAYPLDGVSLLPHLYLGEAVPERDLFWRTRSGRALRRDNLKYVQLAGADHLYDVVEDPREQAELGAKRPDDLAALRAAWEAINATLLPYSA